MGVGLNPPTWVLRCLYMVCLVQGQCWRGLAPDEAGTDATAIAAEPARLPASGKFPAPYRAAAHRHSKARCAAMELIDSRSWEALTSSVSVSRSGLRAEYAVVQSAMFG